MQIPARIPGLKAATILLSLYAAVWITLEAALPRAAALGIGVVLVTAGQLLQKYLGGRRLPLVRWLLVAAVTGLLIGLASGLLTLFFMAVKTGLHAHGPEFTPAEITWVLRQIPLWTLAGLLAGLGLGFLSASVSESVNSKQ